MAEVIQLARYRNQIPPPVANCLRCRRPWHRGGWCHQCTDRLRGALNKVAPPSERCADTACGKELRPRTAIAIDPITLRTYCAPCAPEAS